jgi:hypothetical protein
MLAEIFKKYGREYLDRFQSRMSDEQFNTIHAIQICKTGLAGTSTCKCDKCGKFKTFYRSCGNRNCPLCQYHRNEQWLDKRLKEQLPGAYFMVPFTVPEELRSFLYSSQKVGYSALFKAAAETLKTLLANPKYVGGDLPGFFGVLHTWGGQLQYHPHIHFIVPGGAFSTADGKWNKAHDGFLAPVHAMSKLFRAKFHAEIKKLGEERFINPDVWKVAWNVNSQYIAAGGTGPIKYLAPYVFRAGISNSRIVSVKNRQVTFKYRKKKSSRWRTMTLDAMEFIRRFIQHVLPSGFMKIRYYGFMGVGCKIATATIVAAVQKAHDNQLRMPKYSPIEIPAMKCEHCGGYLKFHSTFVPGLMMYFAPD